MALFESFNALRPEQQQAFAERALGDEALADAVIPSAVQERMIVLAAFDGEGAYNLPWAGRTTGALDVDALREAFLRTLHRHEQLRRRFVQCGGRLVSLPSDVSPGALRHIVVSGLSQAERTADAQARAMADGSEPFEVLGGPLYRLTVVEYAADDRLLLLTVHHAVADGWSLKVLYHDLSRHYEDVLDGRAATTESARTTTYTDYVRAQRLAAGDGTHDRALRRYARQLHDAPPVIDLPVDFPRPLTPDFRGATAVRQMSVAARTAVRSLSATSRTTPFVTCLALFAETLRRYSGEADLVVGVPVLGRPSRDFDEVVGMFVNTIPVRLRLDGADTPAEVVGRVRGVWLEMLDDQDVPLNAVVDHLVVRSDVSRPPLFQVSFAYVTADEDAPGPRWRGTVVRPLDQPGATAKFDLTLTVHECTGDRIDLALEYSTALFDERTAQRILEGMQATAVAAADPHADLRTVSAGLPGARPLRREWADRDNENGPQQQDVLALIAAAGTRCPDAEAVRCADEALTFGELLAEAYALAGELNRQGVRDGSRVAIMLDRSPRLLVAMLGVWAAGGAYVPLDPDYPAPRLSFMLADSDCVALVTDQPVVPAGLPPGVVIVGPVNHPPAAARVAGRGLAGEAYVLYTSGSTGTPKGVSIPHRAVLAMVRGTWQIFGTTCLRRSLATTSVSFDVSTVELFPTLALGGAIHLAPSLFEVPAYPPGKRPGFTAGVPSLLSAALAGGTLDVAGLVVAAGGEELRVDLVERLYAAGAERVANIYGPSEDCTYSTVAFVARDGLPPAIGASVPGSSSYLLDPEGYLVPPGAAGEIHLAGAGLADGYVCRPVLTADRFTPDPYSPVHGARMYRTGDLGRIRPDGQLEYLGRLDRQVKVNGMRIELGEVETAMLGLDAVERCVAVVQRASDSARLGAAVQARTPVDAAAARRALSTSLPGHLIPAVVVTVDRIPQLANGKVDVEAVLALLPPFGVACAPTLQELGDDGHTARAIRQLWAGLLPGSDGRGDFFASGGNSLTALRLALLIRDTFGAPFTIADVFTTRTAAEMARAVDATIGTVTPLTASGDDLGPLALSREQFAIWWIEQIEEAGAAYVIPAGWRIDGPLDTAALTVAVQALQLRHPALRRRLDEVGGQPVTVDGGVVALRVVSSDTTRFTRFAAMPFDLAGGPLFEAELCTTAPDRHTLLLRAHHLIVDGWSFGVIEEDLSMLYAAVLANGPERVLLEAAGSGTVQYHDHVRRQARLLESPELKPAVRVWCDLLAGAPDVLDLISATAEPQPRTMRGTSVRHTLRGDTVTALRSLSHTFTMTPFQASSMVFGLTLMATAGVDDVVFGTPTSGRHDLSIERVVGMFVTTVVMRLDARDDPPAEELARRYVTYLTTAMRHQEVPLDLVVEALAPSRSMGSNPLFQVLFAYDYGFGTGLRLAGTNVLPLDEPTTTAKFDLVVTLDDSAEQPSLVVEYATDLFTGVDIDAFILRFEQLAVSVAAGPQAPVSAHLRSSVREGS